MIVRADAGDKGDAHLFVDEHPGPGAGVWCSRTLKTHGQVTVTKGILACWRASPRLTVSVLAIAGPSATLPSGAVVDDVALSDAIETIWALQG